MTYSIIKPILTSDYALYARASTGTYFDKNRVLQTAAVNTPRINWNPETGVFEGVLVEPERTNLLLNSANPDYQTRSVTTGKTYTLSFYGNGAITLTGAIGTTLSGGGTPSGRRTVLTFTAEKTTLTLAPFGTVTNAQLEEGAYPTSCIPTTSAPVTRAADVITGTGLFMTTFPEPVAEYNPATTYATGQTVRVATRLYESLVDANTGNYPPDNSVEEDPAAKWFDAGASNRFACLDNTLSTGSVGAGPIQIMALKLPQNAHAISLPGSSGTKVHAAISNGAGAVTTQSSTGIDAEYIGQTPVLTGFTGGNIVSIAVETSAAEAVVGELIVGTLHEVGATHYGHRFSLTSYSAKETDTKTWRNRFLRRPSAKRMSCSITVPKANYNAVVTLMQAIDGIPTVHIASDDKDYSAGAIVFGWAEDFDIEIPYPTEDLCNVTIQGLI